MTEWPEKFPEHPAPYSKVILDTIDEVLPTVGAYLDPMCGSGRCFELERNGRIVVGTEIEPAFAALHPRTIVADATKLPFGNRSFDGGFCSPTYPNRMNGDYTAPGWTKKPDGRRNYSLSVRWLERNADVELRQNNTARFSIRRDIARYWEVHRAIWMEVARVIRPGGIFILNTKDLPSVPVTEPHVWILTTAGFTEKERYRVRPPGYRNGANRDIRVEGEDIVVFQRGAA